MEDLEQKRQRGMAVREGRLRTKDSVRIEKMTRELGNITKPKDELEELAENEANKEARERQSMSMGFSEVEQLKFDPAFRKLSDFIGIDPNAIDKYGNELNIIMGWAQEKAKSNNIIDALLKIKKLKKTLGFQETGETAIKKLYRFIRLDIDSKRIAQEKELLKQ